MLVTYVDGNAIGPDCQTVGYVWNSFTRIIYGVITLLVTYGDSYTVGHIWG